MPSIVDDLAQRAASLAREVDAGQAAEANAERLLDLFRGLLQQLPLVDASHHQSLLQRELRDQLQRTLAPLLDVTGEVPADGDLLRTCVNSDAFRRLHASIAATLEADVEGVRGDSARVDREPLHELDDLAPLHELPELLRELASEPASESSHILSEGWRRLQAFAPLDLLESEQWELVPRALLAAVRGGGAGGPADMLGEWIALCEGLLSEGSPAQRAELFTTLGSALALIAGDGSAEVVGRLSSLSRLFSRARLLIVSETVILPAALRDAVVEQCLGLTQCAPRTQQHLAAHDVPAEWLSVMLSGGCWREATWRHARIGALLDACTCACRQPLSVADADGDGGTGEGHAGESVAEPSTCQLELMLRIHHMCALAHLLRGRSATTRDATARAGSAPAGADGCATRGDDAWAAEDSALEVLLARVHELARMPCDAPTKFGGASPLLAKREVALTALAPALEAAVRRIVDERGPECRSIPATFHHALAPLVAGLGDSHAPELAQPDEEMICAVRATEALMPAIAAIAGSSHGRAALLSEPALIQCLASCGLRAVTLMQEAEPSWATKTRERLGFLLLSPLGAMLADAPAHTVPLLLPLVGERLQAVGSASGSAAHARASSALGAVLRPWCSSAHAALALCSLPPAAAALAALSLHCAMCDNVDGAQEQRRESTGERRSRLMDRDGREMIGRSCPCTVHPSPPPAEALRASVLAGQPCGLLALAEAGSPRRLAADFVHVASLPVSIHAGLHAYPAAGEEQPVWRALGALLGLLSWPHAATLACDDTAPTMQKERLREAFDGPVRALVTSTRQSFEARAAGALLLTLLCGGVEASLLLSRRYDLTRQLRRIHYALEADELSVEATELASPPPGCDVAGLAEQLGATWRALARESTTGGDVHAPVVDLSSVYRAQLLTQLTQWGVPSEWAMPEGSDDSSEHLLLRVTRRAAGGGTSVTDGVSSGRSKGELVNVGPSLAATWPSPSLRPRMRAVEPLLHMRGFAPRLQVILRAHESVHVGDELVKTPDAFDSPEIPLPATPKEIDVDGADLPPHVMTGIVQLVRYAHRVGGCDLGECEADGLPISLQEIGLAYHRAVAHTAGAATAGAFDCFAAVCLVVGEPQAGVHALASLASHPMSAYLWPRRGDIWRVRPAPLERLLQLIDDILPHELPRVHAALRGAAVAATAPVSRWLHQSWLNVLPWDSMLAALLIPMCFGADFQVYLCLAALRHIEREILERSHSHALLAFLLHYPLEGFEPVDALEHMFELRGRWHSKCMASLLDGLPVAAGSDE